MKIMDRKMVERMKKKRQGIRERRQQRKKRKKLLPRKILHRRQRPKNK